MKMLGAGGMGSVYLANDPNIGQQVAVKIIRTDLDAYATSASAEMVLERFRQEARAVARLDHLHILPLYRYGEEPTSQGLRAYMIMQYRPEGSLWDWLRRRADLSSGVPGQLPPTFPAFLPTNWPLKLDEMADYVQQAASALQYAHERGIVHRDIKPANFLLRFEGQKKTAHLLLSDFGLAKVFTASSATNTILGTPTYMAPEQFEGAARPESDQYALAVMVYYLLAGRAPFEGDALQLMRQHLSAEVPPITTFLPSMPPAVNAVLLRALAKKPEQRFPSIAAFAEAFQQAILAPQVAPRTGMLPAEPVLDPSRAGANGPSNPPGPLVLPGNAEFGPVAYPAPAPTIYHSPLPTVPGRYPTSTPYGTPHGPATLAQQTYQAGGTTPAFPTSHPGAYPGQANAKQQSISRRSMLGWIAGGAAAVVLGASASFYFLASSHSASQNTPPAGGQTQGNSGTSASQPTTASQTTPTQNPVLQVLRGHTNVVNAVSWLADGSQLASGSSDKTARIWSPAGTQLNTLDIGEVVRAVAWSPDGSKLAVGADDHSLSFWQPDGTVLKRLSLSAWSSSVKALAWSSDSSMLYLGTYGEGLHSVRVSNYAHSGSAIPGTSLGSFTLSLALAPGNRYLASGYMGGNVFVSDLDAHWQTVSVFPASYGPANSVAWSADGQYLAVGYDSNVAIVYSTSSQAIAFTLQHQAAVTSVAWNTSSGSSILASGAADGTVNVWNLSASTPDQIVYKRNTKGVLAVAWNSSGQLASASQDETVTIWQPLQ